MNRITLKNIKHAEFASEETFCYSASVYFDGKRVGTVKNDGHGGCDYEYPTDHEKWAEMEAYIDTLPDEVIDADWHDDGKYTLKPSLEFICHDAVAQWLVDKDIKKITRNKIAFYTGEFDGSYRYFPKGKFPEQAIRNKIAKDIPDAVIINDLPIEKQRELFA